MASVKFDARQVIEKLSKMSDGLGDMTSFFKNVADLELGQTFMRFRTETGPDGKNWEDSKTIRRGGPDPKNPKTSKYGSGQSKELAWEYVEKANYYGIPLGWHWFDKSRGDKILTDTGTLRRSIGIAYGKDFALVGTNLEYAEKHQEGEGVQKREFLGINGQTEKNMETAMTAYLKGLLK